MSELSPEAKKLFEAAREAYSPSTQRLDALQVAMQARIAAPSAAASGTAQATGATGATGAAKVALAIKVAAVLSVATVAVVGAGLLGGGEKAAEPSRPSTQPSAPVQAAAALPVPAVLPAAAASPVAPIAEPAHAVPRVDDAVDAGRRARADVRPTAPRRGARPSTSAVPRAAPPALTGAGRSAPGSAVPSGKVLEAARALPVQAAESKPEPEPEQRSATPRVVGDELDAEVRLLRAARGALDSGAAERALAILDEHAASHPHGTLAQESLATRALALCALGRVSAARAAVRELSRLSPSSPHLARLRASCAGPAEQ